MATKVQLFVAVSEARRVLQRSVAISEADVDASKKPIAAKNTDVAFSVTFFAVMGLLLASTSASEIATNAALCLELDTSSKSESLSQLFRGCFNSLDNFDIMHTSERGLWQRRHVACVLACTAYHILDSTLVLAHSAHRISTMDMQCNPANIRTSTSPDEVCVEIIAEPLGEAHISPQTYCLGLGIYIWNMYMCGIHLLSMVIFIYQGHFATLEALMHGVLRFLACMFQPQS